MFTGQTWLPPARAPSGGKGGNGRQSAKWPVSASAWGPARSGRPSGLPGSARRRVAPRARTRSFERRGPARSAPARPDRGRRGHRPRVPTVAASPSPRPPLASVPAAYAAPAGLRLRPLPVPLRPPYPALPRPAAAASAASRDRAAPAAPAVVVLLVAGAPDPALRPLWRSGLDGPERRRHAPHPSALKGTTLGEH